MSDPKQQLEPQIESNAAVAMLDTLAKETASAEKREIAKDDSQWLYYQQCRRGHPAFFYTSQPSGKSIDPDGWYSTYKRADESWTGAVLCQECSRKDGEGFLVSEEPVQVTYMPIGPRRPTRFMPDPRFLFRMGKTPELRAKSKPHRAQILNITAANVGVPNPDFPESVKTIRRRTMAEVEVRL